MTQETIQFPFSASGKNMLRGFSKQSHKFEVPFCELIDNSLSARKKTIGTQLQHAYIEVIVEELNNGNYSVIVADNGTGISKKQIIDENNSIFNVGHDNPNKGTMNEHGFGLKTAIMMLTLNVKEEDQFTLVSNVGEDYFRVDGPLGGISGNSMEMKITDSKDWKDGLFNLKESPSGVKIKLEVTGEYFKTVDIVGGNPGFEILIERLAEHLGVIYNLYLKEGNEIYLYYKSKSDTEHQNHKIPAIPTPFLSNKDVQIDSRTLETEIDGKKYKVKYKKGLLDDSIKDLNSKEKNGFPYPLRMYFQGSNARMGISIISRKKVLKTGVFGEIWRKLDRKIDYNNFLGELHFDESFATVYTKNGILETQPQYQRIIEQLNKYDELRPEKNTKKQSEERLKKNIIKQIKTIKKSENISDPKSKSVWDGGGQIDVYYENKDTEDVYFYELKINKAKVEDLYQIEMYWDALVYERKKIKECTLVASEFPPNVKLALSELNKKKDLNDNNYVVNTQLMSDF